MQRKKVIVIGAGVAGLSTAIYAARSGFDVTVLEQHSIPGGMCTSWKRKGYLFEGAVHWLTGSSPKTALYELWRDTGALDEGVPVLLDEVFCSAEHEGETVRLYRSIDKTREEFLRVSPEDRVAIQRLYKDVKKLRNMQMPLVDIKGVQTENPKKMGLGFVLKMMPALPVMASMGKISVGEYIGRFKHPAIRTLLQVAPKEYSANSMGFTLATLDMGDGGYPQGGSPAMVRRMAATLGGLGGELRLNTRAERVVVENGKAKGVVVNGETLEADAVVVTQDALAAVDALFETSPQDEWIQKMRRETKPAVCTFVSVGVRAELPEIPICELAQPIRYAGREETQLGFNSYYGYEGYAPQGCTALTTTLMGDTYDFWKQAREEGRYEAEKQALAKQVEQALLTKYPALGGKIDVIDIATPLTYERYTGAHHGSWMSVTGPGDTMAARPGTLEGAEGVYFAGHRILPPGGFPAAVMTGRTAAQHICRQFGALFR